MKAEEFKRFFTDPKNDDIIAKYGYVFARNDHKGFYKCLLCGLPHQYGLRYTIANEDHYICPICHHAAFNTKRRIRNLAELDRIDK